MARMIVVDRDGKEHDIEAKPGLKVMEILRELDYGVAAICGGLCSCATCHVQSPGQRVRAEVLAPALGILNAMPIYRSEWSGMGTTSRRFTTCNSQIRGVPFNPQDDEYRNVEYYLSYVSNGLPISGPGARP